MDKKVTRRAAIGSIIGGMVAAPVAYYFLKGRDTAKPQGKFEREWADIVKIFDLPIKEIDGPTSFTLDYKPQVGTKYRVISLLAGYGGNAHLAEYPQLPEIYFITTGQITGMSQTIENRQPILVNAEKHKTRRKDYFKEEPGAICMVVPRKDSNGMDYFEVAQGAPKKIPFKKVNSACMDLASGLAIDYPKRKELVKGMKWKIPRTSDSYYEYPCEIIGFAEVAGKETVKITIEKNLSNQDMLEWISWGIQQEKEEKERESWKEYQKIVVKEEQTRAIQIISYVDMKMGLNVRYEWKSTTRAAKEPEKDTNTIRITQMFES
jgi:hypothetical protein